MSLPDFSMRGLLEAGAHFGHQSHRWNPKMAPYIFGARNNIHIIDLAQTVPLLHQALKTVSDTVARGGRVLFVGTKRQAQEQIADAAKRSAQYYINSRWLGGTLTNWKTISGSISRLRKLEEQLSAGSGGVTKKERLLLTRERDKLEKALGGIKDMGGTPDLIFVIDTNKEALAIKEANRLKIPVVAILDTNCDPDGVTYPIPANDDAGRAIALYCDLIARAAIDGIGRSQGALGMDIGAAEAPPEEPALQVASAETRSADGSLRAALRPARRAGRSRQAHGRRPADRQEAQRRRRLPLLADCGAQRGGSREARRRSQARRPHHARQLDRAGPRARRRLIPGAFASNESVLSQKHPTIAGPQRPASLLERAPAPQGAPPGATQ